jgi:DNA-binding NarL/FixJ family response regulator
MNAAADIAAHAAPLARPIRVLLADDHAVTLWGLRQLIESAHPCMEVSGTAATCSELLAHPALDRTDVVLLDLGLRDADALGCIPRLASLGPLKVVVLTGDLHAGHHRTAVMNGARGVVLKSQSTERVLQAIERVHAGEVCLDGSLMAMLLGSMPGIAAAHPPVAQDQHARRIGSLTLKERQVIQAVVEHRGAKCLVVSDALGMSEHTLRNHLTVIYSKLGVQGKLGLYAYALERGLGQASAAAA